MKPARPSRALGFTLLELLVAVSVLAVVALLAWRGLDALLVARARLQPMAGETRALLTLFGQLERDLAQVTQPALARPPLAPLLVEDDGQGNAVLRVLRLALPDDPAQPLRVQWIVYRVDGETLVRDAGAPALAWSEAAGAGATRARLLDDVRGARVRLWRDGQGWLDAAEYYARLPAPPASPAAAALPLPAGLELRLERRDGAVVRRVLLVG